MCVMKCIFYIFYAYTYVFLYRGSADVRQSRENYNSDLSSEAADKPYTAKTEIVVSFRLECSLYRHMLYIVCALYFTVIFVT